MDAPLHLRPQPLLAVVVHGPATRPLTDVLWNLGLRLASGATSATVWLPARSVDRRSA